MFRLYSVRCFNGVALVEDFDAGDEAVNWILDLWLEDTDETLYFIRDENGNVWATVARGLNPADATVCKTDGAAQRFRVAYKGTESKVVSLA